MKRLISLVLSSTFLIAFLAISGCSSATNTTGLVPCPQEVTPITARIPCQLIDGQWYRY